MATVVNIPWITQVRKSFHFFINASFIFLLAFFLTILIFYPNSHDVLQAPIRSNPITNYFSSPNLNNVAATSNCSEIKRHHDFKAKCEFLKFNKGCGSSGYIDYLQLFYCIFGSIPIIGYIILILWLVVLFYLLGSTADDYFVPSLKSLSNVLRLTPTMAGVTFLSFGNGAPDVFSSIVSFMGTTKGGGAVGLNSVLGAGFFVSSVVVGVISVSISSRGVSVDKKSFIRDILFYFLTLSAVLVIVTVGAINIWGAMAFVCLYLIYVLLVYTMDSNGHDETKEGDSLEESAVPLLGDSSNGENLVSIENGGGSHEDDQNGKNTVWGKFVHIIEFGFLYGIDIPLSLPRRMTIPVVSDENWSKLYAVISVTVAPVLLAALLWGSQKEILIPYLMGGLVGIVLGSLAIFTTNKSNPPKAKKILLFWLLGGFLMSVTWIYLIAGELVSLLETLGKLFGISPLILGLTVLAWGNSLGDLISNSALAKKGGIDGAQTAISGCYAGPIFNAILGLGLGLLISAWSQYPTPFAIPRDITLYETVGFLMVGLLWALVMTLRNNMKLDKVMGCGLLAIYLCFISLRLVQVLLF
ncbi:hypothetical protein MKW94_011722 [Papaver nudicaule]|uniref:Sodium/calcium exchanger membrane region domain-containing protein n=1 Tax=Papaver nudicaule TaxID=74823 RepID=A0AA41VWL1_PAPNU|nr:hypothetical protein [Papaver nudicaule]